MSIIALMASYVDSEQRLIYLQQCLESIASQTVQPELLLIGICFQEPYKTRLMEMLNAETQKMPFLRVKSFGVRISSQFQIYRTLMRWVPTNEKTWLIFSDDDDLWHPLRMYAFSSCVGNANDDVIVCRVPQLASGKSSAIKTWLDVSESVKHKRLKMDCVGREYVTNCVRLKVIQDFFNLPNVDGLLSNAVCDLYFSTYVQLYHGQLIVFDQKNSPISPYEETWLYFYRHWPQTVTGRTKEPVEFTSENTRKHMERNVYTLLSRPLESEDEILAQFKLLFTQVGYCLGDFSVFLKEANGVLKNVILPEPFANYARITREVINKSLKIVH